MKQKEKLEEQQHQHITHQHHGNNHEREGHKREKSHLLKKRIVKILTRKEQVNFNDLVFQLDVQPSKLFRILKKLEHKGLNYHREDKMKAHKGSADQIRTDKPYRNSVRHAHHQTGDTEERKEGCHHCGNHAEKCERCCKHFHKKYKNGKGSWQKSGNTIGLEPA